MSTSPLDTTIHEARSLHADEGAYARALTRLIKRHPGDPQVGELLLDVACDTRPYIRGLALGSLAAFPDLTRSLPLLAAALHEVGGGYGGGFDESTMSDALRAIGYLGLAATAITPELKHAYARGEETRTILKVLIDVAGPEEAARFAFGEETKRHTSQAAAADHVLSIWPQSLPFPAFLRNRPDPAVLNAVNNAGEVERTVDAQLKAYTGNVRYNHTPRPESKD